MQDDLLYEEKVVSPVTGAFFLSLAAVFALLRARRVKAPRRGLPAGVHAFFTAFFLFYARTTASWSSGSRSGSCGSPSVFSPGRSRWRMSPRVPSTNFRRCCASAAPASTSCSSTAATAPRSTSSTIPASSSPSSTLPAWCATSRSQRAGRRKSSGRFAAQPAGNLGRG